MMQLDKFLHSLPRWSIILILVNPSALDVFGTPGWDRCPCLLDL